MLNADKTCGIGSCQHFSFIVLNCVGVDRGEMGKFCDRKLRYPDLCFITIWDLDGSLFGQKREQENV